MKQGDIVNICKGFNGSSYIKYRIITESTTIENLFYLMPVTKGVTRGVWEFSRNLAK